MLGFLFSDSCFTLTHTPIVSTKFVSTFCQIFSETQITPAWELLMFITLVSCPCRTWLSSISELQPNSVLQNELCTPGLMNKTMEVPIMKQITQAGPLSWGRDHFKFPLKFSLFSIQAYSISNWCGKKILKLFDYNFCFCFFETGSPCSPPWLA